MYQGFLNISAGEGERGLKAQAARCPPRDGAAILCRRLRLSAAEHPSAVEDGRWEQSISGLAALSWSSAESEVSTAGIAYQNLTCYPNPKRLKG
jgi:hypothetical protein